jgi:hypothetical protein
MELFAVLFLFFLRAFLSSVLESFSFNFSLTIRLTIFSIWSLFLSSVVVGFGNPGHVVNGFGRFARGFMAVCA